VFMWAAVVSRWAAFSCRVHANTACQDRGPDTAHYRVMPTLTLRASCWCRVFSVVHRAAHRVGPIRTSIILAYCL
jgi:hypothetical protein